MRSLRGGAPALIVLALMLGACAKNNPKTQSSGALIEGLGGTTYYSTDPAKLADWYTTRFRMVFKPEGSGYLSKETTSLGPLWIAINPVGDRAKERPINVTFFVRNLDRVLGQLSDVGTSPQRLDRDESGRPTATVIDPEGNRIELVQR